MPSSTPILSVADSAKNYLRNLIKSVFLPGLRSPCQLKFFGNKVGYWIRELEFQPDSPLIVVSAGVGFDIDFELELAAEYSDFISIDLLDPSPVAQQTWRSLSDKVPSSIKYIPAALASHTGQISMAQQGSTPDLYQLSQANSFSGIVAPCVSLVTLLEQHQANKIDLLKIDIEGFEYEVLRALLSSRIPVDQIVVEFHDWMLGPFWRLQTFLIVRGLLRQGYVLVHRCHNDYTFLRRNLLDG